MRAAVYSCLYESNSVPAQSPYLADGPIIVIARSDPILPNCNHLPQTYPPSDLSCPNIMHVCQQDRTCMPLFDTYMNHCYEAFSIPGLSVY